MEDWYEVFFMSISHSDICNLIPIIFLVQSVKNFFTIVLWYCVNASRYLFTLYVTFKLVFGRIYLDWATYEGFVIWFINFHFILMEFFCN